PHDRPAELRAEDGAVEVARVLRGTLEVEIRADAGHGCLSVRGGRATGGWRLGAPGFSGEPSVFTLTSSEPAWNRHPARSTVRNDVRPLATTLVARIGAQGFR